MPDRLQQAITILQTRFGSAAPRPAQPDHPARPSGIAELDALTGIGGWPVGRLSLLAGAIGSGKRTIAQRSVAHASREGSVVYIDFPGRLDPQFLSRLDADLGRLLIVRPKNLKEGMASARVLADGMADPEHPVFVSTLRVSADAVARRHPEVSADAGGARILRSVLMKPESESRVPLLHEHLQRLAEG